MRYFLFILNLFVFSSFGYTQDSIVIRGEVREKIDGTVIPNAKVSVTIELQEYATTTSHRGSFTLSFPITKRYDLLVTHQIYTDFNKSITGNSKIDTLDVLVEMMFSKITKLDEVKILAPGIPEKVFGDSILSVSDFEVLKDGKVMLLVYPKRLDKGSELLLWDQSKILNRLKIEGTSEELVRDFRGNPHVVCSEKVCGISITGDKISVSNLKKEYFEKYLSPILDTNKSKLFFSNFNKDYPSFNYYSYDQLDSTYVKIVEITDDLMMELYRSEYKWVDVRTKLWAKNKELQTGIDAEIWVGANYFTQSVYYKQLYAPMFHRNDTLFVFDYYKDRLRRFNEKGNVLDSIPIYHHYHPKDTGWKKKLIQDKITGQVFAIIDIAGFSYIRHVNTETGELGDKIQLEYRYIEKIEIHDNLVYYIYRPFESPQKKYLYKEKLPYIFEKGNVPDGDKINE